MEKELDTLLQTLDKASTTENIKDLNQIEEDLQNLIKEIDDKLKSGLPLSSKNEISDRLTKLEDLINKLESNKNLNNELFLEFKQFIEKRKLK